MASEATRHADEITVRRAERRDAAAVYTLIVELARARAFYQRMGFGHSESELTYGLDEGDFAELADAAKGTPA